MSVPEASVWPVNVTEESLVLDAARRGDEAAFGMLIEAHRQALHLHCYRMLGSLDEAEEALQETLVRAWRGLSTYEGRAPLPHWLHRIATTTCLKAMQARERRPATLAEVGHLQPYPDRLLDPAAVAEQRESVALAFIAALQLLPATQRAVLILRDVLSWSAAEVAALLEVSVPAVNSSLQRARATLRAAAPPRPRPLEAYERAIVARFVDSWRRCDVAALAALLREDAILRMPPDAVEIHGRAAVVEFFATEPAGGRLDRIVLVETAANGQPTLAAYLPDGTSTCRGYGLMVFTVAPDGLAEIIGFPDPGLFTRFGLPMSPPH